MQVWCGIKIGKDSILIGCVYRAPDLNYETNSEILTTIKRARNRVENGEYSSIIVFGDFNHPDINWTQEGVGTSDVGNEKLFIDSIEDSFLTQCVNFTTYRRIEINSEGVKREKESLFDLILTSEPERILEISKGPMLGDTESGHYTLNLKFSIGTNEKKIKDIISISQKGEF